MTEEPPVTSASHSRANWRQRLRALRHDVGLMPVPGCYRDLRFVGALLAAVLVVWLGHDWLPPFSRSLEWHWWLGLSLVMWQPLIEELLFRGIVQGQLLTTAWGRRVRLGITAANLITSLLFVALHLLSRPSLFSLTVFIPSLVFGYFRDRCCSVYPSIVLHAAFNALVLIGVFMHGNTAQP